MNKYQRGKIYKIESMDDEDYPVYIGSMCRPLSERMAEHRSDYKRWVNGKGRKYVTSFELFDVFGLENCKITLIENFPCNSKEELHKREGYYIRSMDCVNKFVPDRTVKEYQRDNKEKIKQWREDNKEKSKEVYKIRTEEFEERNRREIEEFQKKFIEMKKMNEFKGSDN